MSRPPPCDRVVLPFLAAIQRRHQGSRAGAAAFVFVATPRENFAMGKLSEAAWTALVKHLSHIDQLTELQRLEILEKVDAKFQGAAAERRRMALGGHLKSGH